MSDIGWRESIENCRTWNAQMSHKRRARLPFHDASTDTYQVILIIAFKPSKIALNLKKDD